MKITTLETDLLILGGGAAGCYAALVAAEYPDINILVVEKAGIERSGCLAAGINAINAYIGKGHSPQDYVAYAKKDAEGIVREDLLLSMSERLNQAVKDLENMGLTILKDENGAYAERGWRNIKINGENIKPILAKTVRSTENIRVLEHVNVFRFITKDNTILGVAGFNVLSEELYILKAKTVLCATGGAAGLYRPNNPGGARHNMWYPPFNTGAGYAMGIESGAEMTTFEMRFVALRCKGTIAPTGTLAQGISAKQVNSLGEIYENTYGVTTSQRAFGTWKENAEGRGPCVLKADHVTEEQFLDLQKAYLNMAPMQTLSWVENDTAQKRKGDKTLSLEVPVECTEPYIVGGHTASGYWVDTSRQTTINRLYAAGDVAGGCPQKYVSGAMAEAAIAIEAMIASLSTIQKNTQENVAITKLTQEIELELTHFLTPKNSPFTAEELEEGMQQVMDTYAGGIGAGYAFNTVQLEKADERISELFELSSFLSAKDHRELLRIYELRDRLTVCRSVIAHLKARKETRWAGFTKHAEYPEKNDDDWLCYVNSKKVDDEVHIILRNMAGEKL